MIIRKMFADDINRKINGVIKVDQDGDDVIEQELNEYVITKELKKHFITFFNYYNDAFDEPTADMGVWVSGFFGSGKSHFLKILSYILQNCTVKGVKTVERFRKKFEDDPATFMLIDKTTKGATETILFNISIEGSINKDKTAVLRVFAKMFYKHLGFYGENLKVATLEKFLEKQGKTDKFRSVFEENNGSSWLESRAAFAFFEDDVVKTLMEVLGMSETAAHNWFDGTETTEMSIAQLVSEIKEYVDSKPANFRLLFMIDEAGQYVGTDTDMLLDLQSITEKIGSECGSKVWVIATGQEAIDEIIKVRANEFSRIQARFKLHLSLSSSSVAEVIQKRILKKTPKAVVELENVYNQNDSVLRNLFSFSESVLDIKGYVGANDFAVNFPFVPYQFIIMQKVFVEIRKNGNAGKHLSGGERSMLSGFQEATQAIQEKDEYALVPLFRFYDTVHSFLDGSIRRVIERCTKAAEDGNGVEEQDVDILKLLYLVRYIDDIKASIDNIIILMADDISVDKVVLRESIKASLGRLLSQNYIGRTGDRYNFLTDEEQNIQREIKNTHVDTASIVEGIAHIIFGDIYTTKKYRYGKYDFPFNQMVDDITVGAITGGMRLHFFTVATDYAEKSPMHLLSESACNEAVILLADTPYYEVLENAMKIRKYVKKHNITNRPKSMQDIIHGQQDIAGNYEKATKDYLKQAIEAATFYVAGECIEIKDGDAKSKIDQALEYLVSHVYSELTLITRNAESDVDITVVLNGSADNGLYVGLEENGEAATKIEEYLEMQFRKNLPTSMADIQSRYSAIPYGWREIDIAAVVARLIFEQKVTVKYAGNTIQPDNTQLPDMLRKKSEIGKTAICKRPIVSAANIKKVKEFLREYFDVMDVPDDEDSLIKFIVDKFTAQKVHYEELNIRYDNKNKYPDRALVQTAITLLGDILSQQKDNTALIERVIKKEEQLDDSKEALQNVESFFNNQVGVFDAAVKFEADLKNDIDYIVKNEEAAKALNQISLIIMVPTVTGYNYKSIPDLNGLMSSVKSVYDELLAEKRKELLEIVSQCIAEVHQAANGKALVKEIIGSVENFFEQRKEKIAATYSLALLDGLAPSIWTAKDAACERIENMLKPLPTKQHEVKENGDPPYVVPKKITAIHRQAIFPAKKLESEEEIDAYVEKIRITLKLQLKNCDGIQLN